MLIRREGEPWRSPAVRSYTDETALQALVAGSPNLVATGGGVAVVRELSVPGIGFLDIAAVGPDGSLTLVECKLAANPEIRRAVIGQLFAYAAGLWDLSYDVFDQQFAARVGKPLAEAVAEAAEVDDDWDRDTFRGAVEANLRTGRFDLVVAVDAITDELKKVVRYLNEHTVAEIRVLALELGYVADGDVEILVPTVYGDESASRKTQATSVARRRWDEAALFDALQRLCPEGLPVIRRLYEHAVAHDNSFYWGDGASPSVTAYLTVAGALVPVWSCYTRASNSSWDVNFDWMRSKGVPETVMTRLVDRLRSIPGADARLEGIEEAGWRRRPGLPIATLLTGPGIVDQLIAALVELMATPNPG